MYDNEIIVKIIESWATTENKFNTTKELLDWIAKKNNESNVQINKIKYDYKGFWYYDKNQKGIVNRNKSFFQIKGIRKISEDGLILKEQPIIIQNEIGYLGIIGKIFDGVLYFLMQAKIEPGNINKIQISPTIQATKSNFMQTHGGQVPPYLEYFNRKDKTEIIIDQIQSEQSSRFMGKRNRNIIIIIKDDIEVLETHRWMTLGQIKQLMYYDNLVNMDTRTVLSCIPFSFRDYSYRELFHIKKLFKKEAMFNSIFFGSDSRKINTIYQYINEKKMFDKTKTEIIDLFELNNWKMIDGEFKAKDGDFKIVYCDIDIKGREIQKWQQPLLEANGMSIFGLIYCIENNVIKFLIRAISEIGCFDQIELGPSVQFGPNDICSNNVEELFFDKLKNNDNIVFSGLFSEEGGRFYHEQNKNIVMKINKNELPKIPEGYFWIDFQILNMLIQFNNCLNIQLRNLLSILDM